MWELIPMQSGEPPTLPIASGCSPKFFGINQTSWAKLFSRSTPLIFFLISRIWLLFPFYRLLIYLEKIQNTPPPNQHNLQWILCDWNCAFLIVPINHRRYALRKTRSLKRKKECRTNNTWMIKNKIKKSPEYFGTWCGSWGIRTPDPLLVRQMLWTSWAKLPIF